MLGVEGFQFSHACAASEAWPLFKLKGPNAAHADPAVAARHEDTSWHHNCVLEDPRPRRVAVAGFQAAKIAAAAFCRHIHAYPGETGALRQSGGSQGAHRSAGCQPRRQYDSSRVISPCSTGRAARGVVWLCHTKRSTVTPGRSGALHLGPSSFHWSGSSTVG